MNFNEILWFRSKKERWWCFVKNLQLKSMLDTTVKEEEETSTQAHLVHPYLSRGSKKASYRQHDSKGKKHQCPCNQDGVYEIRHFERGKQRFLRVVFAVPLFICSSPSYVYTLRHLILIYCLCLLPNCSLYNSSSFSFLPPLSTRPHPPSSLSHDVPWATA